MFYDGISKWSYTMSTFVQNSGFMVFYEGTRKSAYRKSKSGNEQKLKMHILYNVQNSGFMVFSKDTRKKPWGKCKFGTGQKLKIAVIYVNIM